MLPCVQEHQSGITESAIEELERDLASLERKHSAQFDELAKSIAAVRIKVDGQQERQKSFAARFETMHVQAIEAARSDITEERARDLRKMEGRIEELSRRMDL